MLNRRGFSVFSVLILVLLLSALYRYGIPAVLHPHIWTIQPLNTHNLLGIWLGAFVHGSVNHLLGNLVALVIFSGLFMIQFPNLWLKFWLLQHLFGSFLLWLIGDWHVSFSDATAIPIPLYVSHIGASIWVYAFGGFLMGTAVIQRTKQSLAILFIVLLLFGGFFWGLLPLDPKVSWQGHLSGLIVGVIMSATWGQKWLSKTRTILNLAGSDKDDSDINGEAIEDPYAKF